MSDELKMPYDFRKAVVHMRKERGYHRVETLLWDPDAQHAVIRTWITESAEPREHVLHRYNGSIYHKDVDAEFTPGFDVYRSNERPAMATKRAMRRPTVKRLREEARDIVQVPGSTAIWMERRELQRELETLDYLFIKEPSLARMSELVKLRKSLNNIDQRLAIMSEAGSILEGMEE